jgi:molybdopterin synthase catalytic subunit
MPVRVQEIDFDISAETAALRELCGPGVGAVALFIGTVRDINDGSSVSTMSLEHYPGMTEKSLLNICRQAQSRWKIFEPLIIHRVGELFPKDQIVLVAVASAHRGEAFSACEFVMDFLKTEAPFWKKEQTPDGARWVDARESDSAARLKWAIETSTKPGSVVSQ